MFYSYLNVLIFFYSFFFNFYHNIFYKISFMFIELRMLRINFKKSESYD